MMLKLNDFSLTYDQPFLDDINLRFKPGELTVLTGGGGVQVAERVVF